MATNTPVTDNTKPIDVFNDPTVYEEVVVSSKKPKTSSNPILDDVSFNYDYFKNQDLIRSCKYALWMPTPPNVIARSGDPRYASSQFRKFTYLSESIEFPGKTLSTIDIRVPGKQKIRVPNVKDYNEITVTFYHSSDFPMYEFFSDWVDAISPNSASNSYFKDIVTNIRLIQFTDLANATVGSNKTIMSMKMDKAFTIDLLDAYPINFVSMQSNWADDNIQRLSVTFFYSQYTFNDGIPYGALEPITVDDSLFSKPSVNFG